MMKREKRPARAARVERAGAAKPQASAAKAKGVRSWRRGARTRRGGNRKPCSALAEKELLRS
eukprot:1994686-Pleurochrysis_carterae.AAC.2